MNSNFADSRCDLAARKEVLPFAGSLCVFVGDEMNYMTISEAAKKWNLSVRRVQTLCSAGRIPGTERLGYCWAIPIDAEKPADARVKSGKYVRSTTNDKVNEQ